MLNSAAAANRVGEDGELEDLDDAKPAAPNPTPEDPADVDIVGRAIRGEIVHDGTGILVRVGAGIPGSLCSHTSV